MAEEYDALKCRVFPEAGTATSFTAIVSILSAVQVLKALPHPKERRGSKPEET